MDCDCVNSQHGDQHCTQFQRESSIQHLCNHTCHVVHEFGNVWRCLKSGMLHVCDANCGSRVYRDQYSSICLLSKQLHGPLPCEGANNAIRKRGPSCSADGADIVKRMNSAANAAFGHPQGYLSQEQVMEA